jgi:Flp pilus assembly protein TadG
MKRFSKRNRRGASAVEMAFIAPVFLTLTMGVIESSRLGMVAQMLTTAAREGCRVAVIDGMTQADVQNRIDAVLSGSGISVGTVTPTCPSPYTWNSAPSGTAITVSMSVPFSRVSWLPTPFFLNGAQVSCSATMSSERP